MNLPLSAIIMLIFGAVVLYGGLAYFVYRAFRSKKNSKGKVIDFFKKKQFVTLYNISKDIMLL